MTGTLTRFTTILDLMLMIFSCKKEEFEALTAREITSGTPAFPTASGYRKYAQCGSVLRFYPSC
jgi:hypothetical protein